ncbi:hypothetical protein I4U23_016794 [Adineta vaga]|nr:hypothetical protein I4U23_016794 [Adineta vaga]
MSPFLCSLHVHVYLQCVTLLKTYYHFVLFHSIITQNRKSSNHTVNISPKQPASSADSFTILEGIESKVNFIGCPVAWETDTKS